MTTVLTIKGADFSANAIGFTPPVTSGLKGWWYLGQNAAQTVKDLAFLEDALVVGTPTYGTGIATFTSLSNYLQTGVAEEADGTVLFAARWPSPQSGTATGVPYSALNGSPYDAGLQCYITSVSYPSATIVNFLGKSGGTANIFSQITSNDISTRAFYSCTYASTGAHKIRNITAGTSGSGTFSGARTLNGGDIRIGSSNNTRNATCEMSFWAYYNRVLSEPEQDSVYAAVKQFLADKRSLTI